MSALNTMVGGNHYKEKSTLQPVEFFYANQQLDYQECNIIKYAFRHKNKNGLQDLTKVIHYALIEAELYYGDDKEAMETFKRQTKELVNG